jgi:hypothetical protein
MRPGAMHGQPPEPPSSYTRSQIAWAPSCADPKPEGWALQAQQLDLDRGEGVRSNSWPTEHRCRGAGRLFRASALLEGEQNYLPVACSEQAAARPTQSRTTPSKSSWYAQFGAARRTCRRSRRRGSASDGAHHTRGDSNVPEDPGGLERALASTAVNSEASEPRTVETRYRANWPTHEKATEPRPPGQQSHSDEEGSGVCRALILGPARGGDAVDEQADEAWRRSAPSTAGCSVGGARRWRWRAEGWRPCF